MPKRLRYFISSVLAALGFYLFLGLGVESRYYGLMLLVALVAFCFWFGLGIIFDGSIDTISFVSYDEPFICSARNGYYFHGDRTIQAVDRFVILSKKEIK